MSNGMKFGAVAFLDALGFKGLWQKYLGKNNDADPLVTKFRRIRELGVAQFRPSNPGDPAWWCLEEFWPRSSPEFQISFLSDSIIAACWFENNENAQGLTGERDRTGYKLATQLLWCLAFRLSRLIHDSICGEPRISYRGCISIGHFRIEDSWLAIGPAIDEAASLEREVDAGIVWLAPSARQYIEWEMKPLKPACLFEYEVPIKGRTPIPSIVVNPLALIGVEDAIANWKQWCLSTFDRASDSDTVLDKRRNTNAFLESASRIVTELNLSRAPRQRP